MRFLPALLRGYGSKSALAAALGVSVSTLARWLRGGKPSPEGLERVRGLRLQLQQAKADRRQDKTVFAELMALAAKTADPTGGRGRGSGIPTKRRRKRNAEGKFEREPVPLLPRRPRSETAPRHGPNTTGVRHTRGVDTLLSYALKIELEQWLLSIKRRFPLWQAIITVSEYGRGKHYGNIPGSQGYIKNVIFQFNHPRAEDFSVETTSWTNITPRKADCIAQISGVMSDMLANVTVLVHVHSVTMFNFRYRTKEERIAYESFHRRQRELHPKKAKVINRRPKRKHPKGYRSHE